MAEPHRFFLDPEHQARRRRMMDDHELEILERHSKYPNFDHRSVGEVNLEHQLDITGVIIPRHLERLKKLPQERALMVLDLGCGLGVFNDQLRAQFGSQLDVYGTSLLLPQNVKQRRSLYRQAAQHRIVELMQLVGSEIHRQDQQWRSIIDIPKDKRFDLMFDTFGELFYGGRKIGRPEFDPEDFMVRLTLTGQHLASEGELYIAQLLPTTEHYLQQRQTQLEADLGVRLIQRQHHYCLQKLPSE